MAINGMTTGKWAGLITGLLLLAGCGGGPEAVKGTPSSLQPIQTLVQQGQAPKWITQKGMAFTGKRAVFYGVGNAAGVVNPSLKRRAAEAAARRDLAQEFQVYIAALQKQYQAETTAGAMDKHSVEQHIEDVMKQVTEQSLTGSSIVEYWEHPTRNEAYALARLDLAGFLETVRRYRSAAAQFASLDAQIQEFSRNNAEELHDKLRHEQAEQETPPPSRGNAENQSDKLRRDQTGRGQPPVPKPGGTDPTVKPVKEACTGKDCPGRQTRPDPATFQTGDVIWPRQPWVFIPFNSRPTGSYDPDKAGWESEKKEFIERVKQDPRAPEYDRGMATQLETLSYEEFRARFLSGTEDDEVTAAGWLPWIGHVAMIQVREGKPWVVESTFGGVRQMPYEDWLKERGKSLIWHGRVKGVDEAGRARMGEEAVKQLKKPYQFFNFDLLDDQGFYCSKFVWFVTRRALGVPVDGDPEPKRKFWFSPKQLIKSRNIQLLNNPRSYAGGEEAEAPQSSPASPEVAVAPPLSDRTCETAFSQCLSQCGGPDIESCAESCCCKFGGKQCPSAPDCCPAGR